MYIKFYTLHMWCVCVFVGIICSYATLLYQNYCTSYAFRYESYYTSYVTAILSLCRFVTDISLSLPHPHPPPLSLPPSIPPPLPLSLPPPPCSLCRHVINRYRETRA